MTREIILDIGIGEGGCYINRDPVGVLRIGIDSNEYLLKIAKEQFRDITICVADATKGIPVQENTVDKIQVLFPTEYLLDSLMKEKEIWEEFKRVLKTNGQIEITTEFPHGGGIRSFPDGNGGFGSSRSLIERQSNYSGFHTTSGHLEPDQAEALGTKFCGLINEITEDSRVTIYQITSRKKKK